MHSFRTLAIVCLMALHMSLISAALLRTRQIAGVADSQNVTAPAFIGSAFAGQQMAKKPRFVPDAKSAHLDGGNTRTEDFGGLLGNSPRVSSSTTPVGNLFWDTEVINSQGVVLTSLICGESPIAWCLAALDPTTLEAVVQWTPQGRSVISNYWQVVGSKVVIPTLEGFISVVELGETANGTLTFNTVQEWDISDQVTAGSIIATVGYAGDGNLWFTATGAPLVGLGGTNTTTIGYIQPSNGTVHTHFIQNALVENGAAINGPYMYVVTGPAGSEDHANAVGHFLAVKASSDGVEVIYDMEYDAGSGIKAGGLSRGSGSSVSLIGQKYVAITDNADTQIHLNVYSQASAMSDNESVLACQYPLFQPNASANEAALTTYYDGTTYVATILNSFNSTWSISSINSGDLNGLQNNLTATAPGVTRIDITEEGECSFVWELPIRVTMTTLSTATGLFYVYTQDEELAQQAEWVWYVAAYEFSTGKEVWRAKMGAGGVYNAGASAIQPGPGGRIFEGILGGVAWMQDSD